MDDISTWEPFTMRTLFTLPFTLTFTKTLSGMEDEHRLTKKKTTATFNGYWCLAEGDGKRITPAVSKTSPD